MPAVSVIKRLERHRVVPTYSLPVPSLITRWAPPFMDIRKERDALVMSENVEKNNKLTCFFIEFV